MSNQATAPGTGWIEANFYGQGLAIFTPNRIFIDHSVFQNNSGDGAAFGATNEGWFYRSKFLNNGDGGLITCTASFGTNGGSTVADGNTISGNKNAALQSDRCTRAAFTNNIISVSAWNTIIGLPQCIRIERTGETAQFNQDVAVIGNTCNGGPISIENAAITTGGVPVAGGGIFSVVANHIKDSTGPGIYIADSTNGTIAANVIVNAAAEGIAEVSFNTTPGVGGNAITGNTINGATFCLRQLNAGGTIQKSEYTGNSLQNCSASPTAFVNADYFDRGNISGTASTTGNLTGDVTSVGPATTYNNIVPPAKGGSGASTLTGYVKGNGTSPFTAAATVPTTDLSGTLQAAQEPAHTGDVTNTAGSLATTLATVNSNVGLFGSSTAIPNFTIDGKGRITAAGTNVVIAPAGTLSGTALSAGVTGSSLTGTGTLTSGATGAGFTVALGTSTITGTLPAANTAALTGDVTKSAGSNATTVAAVNFGTATLTGSLPAVNTAALTGDVTKSAGSNATTVAAVNAANISSGTLPAGRMPALTGDCTTIAGAVAATCTKTNGVVFAGSATTDTTNAANISSGALPAARLNGLSNTSNTLGADVALNNTGLYFDGPSIAQGTTGTWWACGQVTVIDTAAANIAAKLWDGTTVIASLSATIPLANIAVPFSLCGYLATPAANIRISVKDLSNTTGLIKFNGSGNSADSKISAFRIN
jgi:hypothetical protein